jgi:hypothetical protein
MRHLGRAFLIGTVLLPACGTRFTEQSHRRPTTAMSPAMLSLTNTSCLPPEVTMNKGAGQMSFLFVSVRLEGGPEFQCVVDTGSPSSLLPKSAEPLLGKRLASGTFPTLDSRKEPTRIYAAPKLYLGDALLMTDRYIGTWDNSFGVLGMDCLHHYCIQLDFEAGKLRFLNPEQTAPPDIGKAYRLIYDHYAFVQHTGFFETGGAKTMLDTGCWWDGCVNSRTFYRESERRGARPVPVVQDGKQKRDAHAFATFPEIVWDGESYKDLLVGEGKDLIGLRFLARHKVTLNFPKGVMHLEQARIAPSKNSW